MTEKLTLLQKLLEIRKSIEYLQKTEKGSQGAMYVDPAVLLKKVRVQMNEYGILLVPTLTGSSITQIHAPTNNNKENKDFLFVSDMVYIWMDTDSPETLEVPWFITGSHMQDPSMAEGGALTYFERYFLLKFFQIPTSKDDPEFFENKTKEKEPAKVVTMGTENVSWMVGFCKRHKLTSKEKKKEFMDKYEFSPHTTTEEEFSIIKAKIQADYNEV